MAICSAAAAQSAPTTQPAGDLMNLGLEDLMTLDVTSVSKHKQKIAEAPAAVSVITQEDIQRSGLQSIPELLRLAPGLDVAQIDANQWAIGSRGFNDLFSNKLLVLMDGRTLYTPLFSGVFWDMQDYVLQDLDRIEVVRGPGATLWGANAVNGVINIETKSARDTQGVLLSGIGGNYMDSGSVRYGGAIDDHTWFRVFTKYRSFNDDPLANGSDAHDGWQSLLGGFRLDHEAGPQDNLTFEASGYGSRNSELLTIPDFVPPTLVKTQELAYSNDEEYVLGRWTHTFSDTSDLALQLYYDHLNTVVWQDNPYRLDTFDIDFQHRFAIGKIQEITWGLGYRFQSDYAGFTSFGPGVESFLTPARRDDYFANQFIQDDVSLVPDRVHVIPGIKLEENSYSNFETEPSLKVLWTPNDSNTVWGSIARAVRTPSRWEQDATLAAIDVPTPAGLPGLVQTTPNPHFESEELIAYELGYRVRPTKSLTVDVNGFYNHYGNLQGFIPGTPTIALTPPGHLIVPVSIGNDLYGHSYGGELSANWKVNDRWRLSGSYSLQEIKVFHSQPDPLGQAAYDQGASPENQFQIHSYFDVMRNVQFNASGYYVQRLPIGIPSYFRVDLNVVWRPVDNLTLTFAVQNLFDNHHPAFGGFRVIRVPSEVPRTFYGQLTWSF